METAARSRRNFLGTLIAFIAGLFLLHRYLTPRMPLRQRRLVLPKAEVPPEGALVYRQARMAVIRSGESLHALELVCTHLGCTVSVTPGELVCPCHGSRFDREGNVIRGPADRPLKRHRVEISGQGFIILLS
ncbi:ubiquinol-cytochrome c reductase iron-sulfur subunit [Geobacter sp. DSM 9736]|uniref:QcrA and Rieske domain-containing protein n=1 Tax=Geobacter sp. DSM 9736 TaxID=1277350 RepID=UPI000B50A93C|nr:Rieske (2Fe-2S) protein [Geobacter sp. DSM 9736]SNB44802.1 Rieske [2Fe-2S] domain-containing protein [Geobacter sp. DSM 9736]